MFDINTNSSNECKLVGRPFKEVKYEIGYQVNVKNALKCLRIQ